MDFEMDRASRYQERDFYDRYDYDREMDYYSQAPPPPPIDDPLYRMPRPLLPHPMRDLPLPYTDPIPEGAIALGRVILYPLNPLEPRPKCRARPPTCRTVFVGSLPESCLEKHLYDMFSACGEIVEARVARGRSFGHVQFKLESSVDRAINLSGCKIRIENSPLPKDCGRIHVDYAQDKAELELKKRVVVNDLIPFSQAAASTISADLHKEGVFSYAAKNVANWLNKGDCKNDTSGTFFDLIANVNSYARKLAKYIQNREEEELEFRVKKQEYFSTLQEECKVILEVYEGSASPKARNLFTKPQRKTISQWKEQAMDIQERVRQKLTSSDNGDGFSAPPSKIMKVEGTNSTEEVEAKLERALKEIGQLKIDREVAIEKREKQILQLKTLMAKFKKGYPEQWGEALGVAEKVDDSSMNLEEKEVIGGVSLDDLNEAMDKDASETSLASAAAAYANIKKSVGSMETSGLGLSEAEVAIVAVLSAYLTVHPLGASLESITSYFQTFNPAYSRIYLEALLHRLSKVFQQSASGDGGEKKWWFLGFQTCYATPTSATPTSATPASQDIKEEESLA